MTNQQTISQLRTNSKILCASISPSTTHIATGHENFNINLFRVVYNDKARDVSGYSNNLNNISNNLNNIGDSDADGILSHELRHVMELKGHKSPVTSMLISPSESYIMTGSDGGSIKYFDLRTEKVVRTMTPGHRSMVTCLAFIPKFENKQYASSSTYNLFASGSMDTNLKIWDLRMKREVYTLKGHFKGVRCCKFTPDSMWIVSGSESGTVKIFDIAGGKELYSFEDAHSKAVNDIDFHPEEYLLATASSDKSVKLWDLDSKQLVNVTPITSTKIQKIQFIDRKITQKNIPTSLIASSKDNLKVWQFEPCQNLDQMDVSWPLLSDVKVNTDTLEIYSCSSYGNTFALQTIPLSQLAPFGDGKRPSKTKIGRLNTPSVEDILGARPPTGIHKEILPKPNAVQSSQNVLPSQNIIPTRSPSQPRTAGKSYLSQVDILSSKKPRSRKVKDIIYISDIIDSSYGANLKLEDFIPQHHKDTKSLSETKLLRSLQIEHKDICKIASSRSDNYRAIRRLWNKGNRFEAVSTLSELKDDATTVLILRHLLKSHNTRYFTLDFCKLLLPLICGLLIDRIHSYHEIGLNATHILYRSFSQFIKQSLSAPVSHLGVDLSAEARIEKCKFCREYFVQIRKILATKNFEKRTDEIGESARNVAAELETFM